MREKDPAERLAEVMKALANPIRLKILALCLVKERTSRELRELLGISKPLLIVHLRKLTELGLLDYRVEFDKEKMLVKKYYRTSKSMTTCIDEEILKTIAKSINQTP